MNNLNEKLLDDTEKFLNRPLSNKSDLFLILKAYNREDNFIGFEELCFTGKYLHGLFKVFEKSVDIPEVKNMDDIKREISDNVQKIIESLTRLNSALDEKESSIISKRYLQLNQNSVQHLQSLAEDFDDIKKYLNYLKTKT